LVVVVISSHEFKTIAFFFKQKALFSASV